MAAQTPMYQSTLYSVTPPPNSAETGSGQNAVAIGVIGPSGPHQTSANSQKKNKKKKKKKKHKKKCRKCHFANGNRSHKCKKCLEPFIIKNEGMKSNDIAKRKRWEESDVGFASKKRRKTTKNKPETLVAAVLSPTPPPSPVPVLADPEPRIEVLQVDPVKLVRQTADNESIGPPKLVRRSTLDILVDLLGPVDPEDTFDDNMTFDPSVFDDFGPVEPMQQNTFDLDEIEPFEF